MNISLPHSLKAFIDEQVSERGFATSSEYVRELIRREFERYRVRAMVLEGAASPLTAPMNEADFEELRELARGHLAE
ncbi:MAG TPA: type II toxin-antitoxin system ParD family antitoxin [Phenylobacterium sp.]|nr:type II toxin-antitoxin system ParD family antitoxin [Phenylobacterium sp.]